MEAVTRIQDGCSQCLSEMLEGLFLFNSAYTMCSVLLSGKNAANRLAYGIPDFIGFLFCGFISKALKES